MVIVRWLSNNGTYSKPTKHLYYARYSTDVLKKSETFLSYFFFLVFSTIFQKSYKALSTVFHKCFNTV